MRSKRFPKPADKKNFTTNNDIKYKNIDININCPTLRKVCEKGNTSFCELPELQNEVEHILSNLGNQAKTLLNSINGKSNDNAKLFLNGSSTSSSVCPNGDSNQSDKASIKELVVKSIPDKPLTLIIAQTRSRKKRIKELLQEDSEIDQDPSTSTLMEPAKKRRKETMNDNVKSEPADEFNGILPVLTPTIKTESKTASSSKPVQETPVNQINKTCNYEIPNKFWELMEPYCAEINEEHIKTLEAMISAYEDDEHYYEKPAEVSFHGANVGSGTRRDSINTVPQDNIKKHLNGFVEDKNGIDVTNLLKKIDTELRRPLSQKKSLQNFPYKFVQHISQDNSLVKSEETISESPDNYINTEITQSSKSIAKHLKVNNNFKLERHIKKNLDDLGLTNTSVPIHAKLESHLNSIKADGIDDTKCGIKKSSECDLNSPVVLSQSDYVELSLPNPEPNKSVPMLEISDNKTNVGLTEMNSKKKKCNQESQLKIDVNVQENKVACALEKRQAELRLVSELNLGMLKRLLSAAKRDMKMQEIERRLAVADADVIEAYNVIESYRPTHKQPLKKDRDAAYRALKERQKILKELDLFDSEFF